MGIPSKKIKEASTFDIAGDAGIGYVMLSALTEIALARKFKHPKGFKCHYTFRIGARKSSAVRRATSCCLAAVSMVAALRFSLAAAQS